jgi:hypothetical protein
MNPVCSCIYSIQQMPEAKRRRHLISYVGMSERQLPSLVEDFMKQKLPATGPDLSLDHILDFQGAMSVHVSRESIQKNHERVKNRLAHRLLTQYMDPNLTKSPGPIFMLAMQKAGLITDEDSKSYNNAKRERDRVGILHRLWARYYLKAWGKTPD